MNQQSATLINPQSGELAIKVCPYTDPGVFDHIARLNYFSILWIRKGCGSYKADFSEYTFSENQMLFFSPYQPFMLMPDGDVEIQTIHFHPDFFCIEKHKKEVACNGVLFNNIYQPPFITVPTDEQAIFDDLRVRLLSEMRNEALAQYDLLISYLKIWLIHASRLKVEQRPAPDMDVKSPGVLYKLRELIEFNFKEIHAPSAYADKLSMTLKALGKLCKTHFSKTLSELIHERIVIEAKRELYLTDKPVKEIAYELGFNDEYYFSRFFKKMTDISPQLYRDTVGHGKLATLEQS